MQNYEVARVLLCGCSGTQGTGSRQKKMAPIRKKLRRHRINVSGYVCNHGSLRMGTRHCVLFRGSLWERLQRDRLPEA